MSKFFRDVVLRNRQNISIRVFGVVHSSSSRNLATYSPLNMLQDLVAYEPASFLVETTPKSLDISKFVFSEYISEHPTTPEQFCVQESDFIEAPALVASHQLPSKPHVVPIDVNSLSTRLRLVRRLLLHPLESMILVSRYHGQCLSEVKSLEEVDEWRRHFQSLCPTAFSILFSDREEYMCNQILHHASISEANTRIAVLVGISHANAIYDRLVSFSSD